MHNTETLRKFLELEFPAKLQELTDDLSARWGSMNAHQMVEHLGMAFLMSTGKFKVPLTTAPEKLPVLKRYLMSERDLPQNFQNPVLPGKPVPVTTGSIAEAKKGLLQCIQSFFLFYEQNPTATAMHNVYGELNFEEWLVMHCKHIKHHFAQFGIAV